MSVVPVPQDIPLTDIDEKNLGIDEKNAGVLHIHAANPIAPGGILSESADGVRKSTFDGLAIWQTVKVFKRAVFYCCIVYTLSMLDGWSVSYLYVSRSRADFDIR